MGNEYKQLVGIENIAAASVERFKVANSEALASYIDLGNSLRAGCTLSDPKNVGEGLNTVLVKNKASAAEAASATLQLNQALGAGRPAGENSSSDEAAPQVSVRLPKLGRYRGEVKELASEARSAVRC